MKRLAPWRRNIHLEGGGLPGRDVRDRGELAGGLVVTCRSAGLAVQKTVLAEADVNDRLAEAAEFLALALGFRLFTLGAAIFDGTGCGRHRTNLARRKKVLNMTLVTYASRGVPQENCLRNATIPGSLTPEARPRIYNSQQ